MKVLTGKRRYTPVILMFVLGIFLSVIASITVWNWEKEEKKNNFHNQADKLATALQQSIDINLENLQASGKLYAVSKAVEREEFKIFVRDFMERYPSILAMGWTRRVFDRDRQAFERSIQAEGFPNFQIIELDATGKIVRAKQRSEYFAVTYVQSSRSQMSALGFNLNSEPKRREVMDRSRDTGKMAATPRITIVTDRAPGFITFKPVYRNGASIATLQQRRENLQGFVNAVFLISDIIKNALSTAEVKDIDFYVFDKSDTEENSFLSFYDSSTNRVIGDNKPLKITSPLCLRLSDCIRLINVANRQWSIVVVPHSEYTNIQTYWRAWTTLLCGLLLTSIPLVYLLLSLRHAKQLEQTLHELRNTQTQLIQTEKMSSLGQLVAGVAHEINNPVNFIHGNLTHTDEYIQNLLKLVCLYQQHYPQPDSEIQHYIEDIDLNFLIEDLPKILSSMKVGTERIREIVLSLRNFSRLDESEMKLVDIHEGIDSTLLILQNKLKAKLNHPVIQVIKEYGDLPDIECYVGQLNQVFMNILSNAIDAIEQSFALSDSRSYRDKGKILIRTEVTNFDSAIVRIADSGIGITPQVKSRLFDPFFTTKPVGKGTGLGLSIAYQIVVEKHDGVIRCESKPGQGTEFWIEIPIRQNRKSKKLKLLK